VGNISAGDLIAFIQACVLSFHLDMLARNPERERKGLPPRDYRDLLSLDDPWTRLIESPTWDVLTVNNKPNMPMGCIPLLRAKRWAHKSSWTTSFVPIKSAV